MMSPSQLSMVWGRRIGGCGTAFVAMLAVINVTAVGAKSAAAPALTSTPSAIEVPFIPVKDTGGFGKGDSFICFQVASSDVPTFTRVYGDNWPNCISPKLTPKDDALKAGKTVVVVLYSVQKIAGRCGNWYVRLNKQSVTPTVRNPLWTGPSASPTAPSSKTASPSSDYKANVQTSGFQTSDAYDMCAAVYPDPLTADTYTTIDILNGNTADATPYKDASTAIFPIHTFYRFAASQGFAISTVKTRTYGYNAQKNAAENYGVATTSNSALVEPLLFLTYYPWGGGLDPEAKAKLFKEPGIVFGLSEKNPTSSFYLGIAFEPINNISVIFGGNFTQVSRYDPSAYDPGATAQHLTPTTHNVYCGGAFVAVAYNFSTLFAQAFK